MIQLTRYAETVGIVTGAEEDHVDAGRLTDLVDLIQRLRIFDLHDDKAIALYLLCREQSERDCASDGMILFRLRL